MAASKIWSFIGLTLGMIGAWLLASGYLEIFARAASGLGGGASTFKEKGSSHFNKRLLGLILLVVGFFSQGVGILVG